MRSSVRIAALTGAIMLLGAQSALAGDLGATVFEDGKRRGDATLLENGDVGYKLIACDTDKDGYGVVAYAWSDVIRDEDAIVAKDVNGKNKQSSGTKGCATTKFGMTGERLYLQVCRQDHDGNVDPTGTPDCSKIKSTTND